MTKHRGPSAFTRAAAVLALLAPVHCLEILQDGSPKHPLYVPASRKAIPYG